MTISLAAYLHGMIFMTPPAKYHKCTDCRTKADLIAIIQSLKYLSKRPQYTETIIITNCLSALSKFKNFNNLSCDINSLEAKILNTV